MSGARGCFNCGGCAWRFRVVCSPAFEQFLVDMAKERPRSHRYCLRSYLHYRLPRSWWGRRRLWWGILWILQPGVLPLRQARSHCPRMS
ncbi:hypothetical protein BDR05DRAFT_265950 [Suillus weaverae]|nr:hypothetical protein BDR05DRAFT_265950 [Suillus weaverae]